MIPFGVAYIVSLMLRPIVKQFYSSGIQKKLMALALLFSCIFVFAYPIVKGVKTITEESHKIEYYLPKLELYLRKKYSILKIEIEKRFNYEIDANPVDKIVEVGEDSTKSLFVYLPMIFASLLEWSLIIPLFLFFMLKDERSLRFQFLKIVPISFV